MNIPLAKDFFNEIESLGWNFEWGEVYGYISQDQLNEI